MIISYHDLLHFKSDLTVNQEYEVLITLAKIVCHMEKEDPDKIYADVVHRWTLSGTPGYDGIIEITDVPDPDHLAKRICDIKNTSKTPALRAHQVSGFRAAVAEMLARFQRDEDIGALRYTYASVLAGTTDLDSENENDLLALLCARMTNDTVQGDPYVFFIPLPKTLIPLAIVIEEIPDLTVVKRDVLARMRAGKIAMSELIECSK